jgi:hypothetical protein
MVVEIGDTKWDVAKNSESKILEKKPVANVKTRMSDPPCWKALLKSKQTYIKWREVLLNKGDIVRFWFDT